MKSQMKLPKHWKLMVNDKAHSITGREAAPPARGGGGGGPSGVRAPPPQTKEEMLAQLEEMRSKVQGAMEVLNMTALSGSAAPASRLPSGSTAPAEPHAGKRPSDQ